MFISGNIRKTLFKSNNGYTVGLIKVRECSPSLSEYLNKTITFTCVMPEVNSEIYYSLKGNLVNHPRYGIQFNASSYEVSTPSDANGLIAYLSSGVFKGIGLKSATNIVNMFGTEALDIIKKDYNNILIIPGITKSKAKKMQEKLLELESNEKQIIMLSDMGFSVEEAIVLTDIYKSNLINILKTNFYSLKEYVNFPKLDSIFLKEHNEDEEVRIKALIPYVMNNLCYKTGDTYVSKEDVYISFLSFFNTTIDIKIFEYYINELNKEKVLLVFDEYLMLKEYYETEKEISDFIKQSHSVKNKTKISDIKYYLEAYEKTCNITFNDEQKEAIIGSLTNNFFCITGGPGTGKTTIIKAIVDIYKLINYKKDDYGLIKSHIDDIILLAPTGRSAKKISESVEENASTIHKFLKWNRETKKFGINEKNKSKAKLVIIDEVSMMDIFLFSSLIKALKEDVQIILVGDVNQLPSISPGNVLDDILKTKFINKIYLEKIYRAKKDSYIIELAKKIKNKEIFDNIGNHSDFTFINTNDINTKKYLTEICERYKGSLDDFEVLVPMYKGENGIDNLNSIMQDIFNNKDDDGIRIGSKTYKVNDKVIQLVNDVDNNVFNGDIGYITNINEDKNEIEIDFMGTNVTYKKDKYDNFSLAYAISIHKSQGSEYDNVVIVLSKRFKRMLYNKLIYTAVTRAKKGLVIIGSLEALNESIKNEYATNRLSKLYDLLNE